MSAPSRVAVDTNIFELCALRAVEWRVFKAPVSPHSSSSDAAEAFAALVTLVTQSANALFAWQLEDGGSRLWVFSVNHAQKIPANSAVDAVMQGEWRASSKAANETLRADVAQHLFRSLHGWLSKQLMDHSEFRFERELFTLNEARFVYRSPSMTRVNEFEVFLDEDVTTVGFQLHFQLLQQTNLLCVNVEALQRDALSPVQEELGSLSSAWMRLLGLPRDDDYSMVDVWHLEENLVPRTVAETAYDDILPRFRSIARRKLKRHSADSSNDAPTTNDGDGMKGKDDTDEAGDDTAPEAEADGDEPGVVNGKKKKRKKTHPDEQNDESIVPVSPDTHVNSPEATGPVVCMTFPFDQQPTLRTDGDVHVFKRRRRKKNKTNSDDSVALSFEPLTAVATRPMSKAEHVSSLLAPPKTTEPLKPPALSLAVSLVASLTQDEKQEALDIKPVKVHPLLQALDAFVEKEMSANRSSPNGVDTDDSFTRLVPIAPAFSPPLEAKKLIASFVPETSIDHEALKNQLLSNRFSKWLTGYFPRDYRRSKKQRRRDRERSVLLKFDESKMIAYEIQAARMRNSSRDEEIAIGVQLATRFASTPWHLVGDAKKRWTPYAVCSRAADNSDMIELAGLVNPHLTHLQGVITGKSGETGSDDEAGEVRDPWLSLEAYVSRSGATSDPGEMRTKSLDALPTLCVSSIESSLSVAIPAISEYMLRNFQPVSAPKPIDYVVVCPLSPAQWLGTLSLSYLTMLRSVYAQASLGDQVALDVSSLSSDSSSVHVDSTNAMLLVDCATSSDDAFAPYRAAGEVLRPLVSQPSKSKQAFTRSPVGVVVYVVAPFRRADVKHKLWMLGALGRGLYGEDSIDSCVASVTIELLYLEDLIDVGVDTNPFALLPAAMALYDRVFESVVLKPMTTTPAQTTASKSRLVCERLYHLSTPAEAESSTALVHVGYAVSPDGNWLLASYTDASGSLLESRAFTIGADGLTHALLAFVESALEFVALVGDKATVAITRLASTDATAEAEAWNELASQDAFMELMARYECVVTKILVFEAAFIAKESVQVRRPSGSLALISDRESVLVVCPDDPATLREKSRVSNAAWLRSAQRPPQQTALLRVTLVHSSSSGSSGEEMEALVTDFTALSYLTVHPVTLERQSPLPLHLAVVDKLVSEMELLRSQLVADPFGLRR